MDEIISLMFWPTILCTLSKRVFDIPFNALSTAGLVTSGMFSDLDLLVAATSSSACCTRGGIIDDWAISSTSLAVEQACEDGGWGNGASSTSATLSRIKAGCHLTILSSATVNGGLSLARNSLNYKIIKLIFTQ